MDKNKIWKIEEMESTTHDNKINKDESDDDESKEN